LTGKIGGSVFCFYLKTVGSFWFLFSKTAGYFSENQWFGSSKPNVNVNANGNGNDNGNDNENINNKRCGEWCFCFITTTQ